MGLHLRNHWLLAATRVALLPAIALGLLGCSSGGNSATESPVSLGKPLSEDAPLVCTACLSEDRIGKTVSVEGEIVQQCPASGCWFRMKDGAGEAFVDLAPAKLRLIQNRLGQNAKVQGRLVKSSGNLRLEAQYVEFPEGQKDSAAGPQ